MAKELLSSEIASLVHHVELNKSGWWDKAIQRFILAAIWLAGRNLEANEIKNSLHTTFFLEIDTARIKKQADALCTENTLVRLSDGMFKISERSHKEFEKRFKRQNRYRPVQRKDFLKYSAQLARI